MFTKALIAFAIMAHCNANPHGHATSYVNVNNHVHGSQPVVVHGHGHKDGHGGHEEHVDYFAPAKYEFKYGVEDPHTKDKKSQFEVRDGHKVHGQYSLHEPDGTIRIVKYTADKHDGFNAQVIRIGHAMHPEHHGGKGHGH